MKKIILTDEEYELLQKILREIPPAKLPRFLSGYDGADMFYYRNLLTKVLRENRRFPDTDDGMEQG